MATFKVGQRVKKIAASHLGRETAPIGSIGTIVGAPGECYWGYDVVYDNLPPTEYRLGSYGADHHMLAPLTDPGADAFMERIKKLKPYDEPVVAKTKERA
jgi:hypothetical protein